MVNTLFFSPAGGQVTWASPEWLFLQKRKNRGKAGNKAKEREKRMKFWRVYSELDGKPNAPPYVTVTPRRRNIFLASVFPAGQFIWPHHVWPPGEWVSELRAEGMREGGADRFGCSFYQRPHSLKPSFHALPRSRAIPSWRVWFGKT